MFVGERCHGFENLTIANPKTELRALTGLRGLAALYVVFYHLLRPAFANPISIFFAHGYLAVDLFFALSGFVMAMNYSDLFQAGWPLTSYRKFLGRRIARIYPLYIVASAIGFVELFRHHPATASVAAILSNLSLIQTWGIAESFDGPSWSISAEWAAYLLFPILMAVTMYAKSIIRWAAALASAGTLVALTQLPVTFHGHDQPNAIFDLVGHDWAIPVFRCIAEFTLGILAYLVAFSSRGRALSRSGAVAILLCGAVLFLLMIPRADLAVILLYPMLIVSLTTETHIPGRILASDVAQFLGRVSYSIYLFHTLFALGIQQQSQKLLNVHRIPHPHAISVALSLGMIIPISYVGYRFIEVPGRRIVRNFFERRISAPPAKAA